MKEDLIIEEIGEFWDKHDLAENWDKTGHVEFEVDLQSEQTYNAVDNRLSEKIQAFAKKRGISPNTLLNLLLQEKLQEHNS
jgi:putative ribosome biogenesis GTPase RsgA